MSSFQLVINECSQCCGFKMHDVLEIDVMLFKGHHEPLFR